MRSKWGTWHYPLNPEGNETETQDVPPLVVTREAPLLTLIHVVMLGQDKPIPMDVVADEVQTAPPSVVSTIEPLVSPVFIAYPKQVPTVGQDICSRNATPAGKEVVVANHVTPPFTVVSIADIVGVIPLKLTSGK